MDKLEFSCLFCGTLTEVVLETGYGYFCDCGAYAVVISESAIDEQKKEISEKLRLPSPEFLLFGYKTVYYRLDPLIILWGKVPDSPSASKRSISP